MDGLREDGRKFTSFLEQDRVVSDVRINEILQPVDAFVDLLENGSELRLKLRARSSSASGSEPDHGQSKQTCPLLKVTGRHGTVECMRCAKSFFGASPSATIQLVALSATLNHLRTSTFSTSSTFPLLPLLPLAPANRLSGRGVLPG